MENKEFAKIWNDSKKSNEEIGTLLGGGKFDTAYNKKSRKPLSELCTLKRTKNFDPTIDGKTSSKKASSKKPAKAKAGETKPKAKKEKANAGTEQAGGVIIVTAHFRKPDGSDDIRVLESDNKEEIWTAIQQLSAKYGNTNTNVVDRSNRHVIKTADALYDTLQVNLIRIPDGGRI